MTSRYAIERELGRGGMATVYLARDLKHGRHVALKVLRPDLTAILGGDRFLQEIRVTAALQHPHILPLLDSGEAAGLLYYVMPYVEGESLRARLARDGPLPLAETLQIARGVAGALDYAHRQGVIHRDVKPENILLFQGEPMVADFGISLAISTAGKERLTETGLSLGTPAYMSPEQAAADPKLDGRADQYSLACVVYEMLAGEPPYTGPNAGTILVKAISDPTPSVRRLRADVPAALDAAIVRALGKTPAERFPTMAAFSARLADTSSAPTERVNPIRLPRRRLVWLAGAATIIAAVAATTLLPAGARIDSRRVLVLPFENRTGADSLDRWGHLAAEWVSRSLQLTDSFEVFSPSGVARSTGESALEYARRAGAGVLISGSVMRDADSLRFVAQLTDVSRGTLRQAVEGMASSSTPAQALDLMAGQVATAVLQNASPQAGAMLRGAARAPSYAAFQTYSEAHRLWDLGEPQAPLLFRRAHELDTTFVLPLVYAGFIYRNRGQLVLAESLGSVAQRRRDRLTPIEQGALDRMLAEVRGVSRMQAYAASRRTFEADTGSSWARCLLAEDAMLVGYPRETVRLLEGRSFTGGAYTGAGWCEMLPAWAAIAWDADPATAVRRVQAARLRLPTRPSRWQLSFPWVTEMFARARLGETDSVLSLRRRPPHAPQLSRSEAAWIDTWLIQAALEPAPALVDSLADMNAAAYAPPGPTDTMPEALVAVLYLAGRFDAVTPQLERLARRDTSDVLLTGRRGALAARRNDTALVRAMDGRLAALDSRNRNGAHTLWRARIAALSGKRDDAVRLLAQALDQGATLQLLWYVPDQGEALGVRWDPDFAPLRGYPPFEALLRPKDSR
jgi:TolB-like protein